MPMIWDSVLVGAVARELRESLVGTRLRGHLFDWDRRCITLFFRESTLRWQLHPSAGWVTLDPPQAMDPEAKPLTAEVRDVHAPPDERILFFELRKSRGLERSVRLVVELMTNQWNALLLEGDEGWIRHALWTRRLPDRTLASGQAYQPPPPSDREGAAGDLSPGRWSELVPSSDDADGHRALLDQLAFASAINLPDLVRSGGHDLWLALRSGDDPEPCVLEFNGDKQPYPYAINSFNSSSFPSVLAALRAVSEGERSVGMGEPKGSEALRRALDQARGRVRGLEREMAQAADPEDLREKANLLLARLGEVERGSKAVNLLGFSGEAVTLDLDPSLSPHENAQALYEEAARRERAAKRLPTLLDKARERAAELEGLESALDEGRLTEEDLLQRLPSSKAASRWRKSEPAPRLPYRRFRSSGGLEIRVGRGSKDNDLLTFKHSHPEDVWLHAREAGGAHVLLRWREEDAPPARDLEEAATLAALNSKARGSQTVPVDWTRRKYVRKPRKAPPGTVIMERGKTLFVEPDPDLPERLAWEK